MKTKQILLSTFLYVFGWSSTTITHAFGISANAAWMSYKGMLVQKPLLTKAITSCAITGFSDILCQNLQKKILAEKDVVVETDKEGQQQKSAPSTSIMSSSSSSALDYNRFMQASVTGLVWSGPITHFWYETLDKILQVLPIQGTLLQKIFLDAIIFSPVTISGYFLVRSLLEGKGLDGGWTKVKNLFVPTLFGAWKFWPAANIINFGLIAKEYRVLFVNVLGVFWAGYLTYVNSKKIAKKN
jgi:protein Mpv17